MQIAADPIATPKFVANVTIANPKGIIPPVSISLSTSADAATHLISGSYSDAIAGARQIAISEQPTDRPTISLFALTKLDDTRWAVQQVTNGGFVASAMSDQANGTSVTLNQTAPGVTALINGLGQYVDRAPVEVICGT